jgi:hypothetical protein
MRWTSLCAASLLAAGIVLFQQSAANSANNVPPEPQGDAGWTAEVAMDDGAPREVAPQSFEALRAKLEPDDPLAVLEAIGFALAEVGDGSAYVWHRLQGPLMGNVRMIGTYRDTDGSVCRRMAVTLVLGPASRPANAVACRDAQGQWVLGG